VSDWDVERLLSNQELPEQKRTTTTISIKQDSTWLFDKYSSLNRLVHEYILRFINNCHSSKPKLKKRLSRREIDAAMRSLVKMIQSSAFADELKHLMSSTNTKDQQASVSNSFFG